SNVKTFSLEYPRFMFRMYANCLLIITVATIRTTEQVNWTTTNAFRNPLFFPSPGMMPFNASAGLNEDSISAGYTPANASTASNAPPNIAHTLRSDKLKTISFPDRLLYVGINPYNKPTATSMEITNTMRDSEINCQKRCPLLAPTTLRTLTSLLLRVARAVTRLT